MDKRFISIDPKTLKIVDSFFTEDIDNYGGRSTSLIHMLVDRDINIRNTKIIKVSESEYKINPIVPEEQYNEEYSRQTTLEAFKELRQERNTRLAEVDWVFSGDYKLSPEEHALWVTYRKTLRELPSTTEDPANPTWPEKQSVASGETKTVNATAEFMRMMNENTKLSSKITALERRSTDQELKLIRLSKLLEK